MANIRANKEQERALIEVTANMEFLRELDTFLAGAGAGKAIALSYESDEKASPRAKKVKVTLPNNDKAKQQISKAVDAIAKKVVKDVRDCLKRFPIELDEPEETLLARFTNSAAAGETENDTGTDEPATAMEDEDPAPVQGTDQAQEYDFLAHI